jgi:hypothetical protein
LSALQRASAGAALAVLLVAVSARAEWTDWVLDADLAARYESNVNRAAESSEEESDAAFRLNGQAGRFYQLGERTRLLAAADVAGELYAEFDDLAAVEAGGQLALLHKLGVGDAPWLRAFASGGYRGVRDAERSGPQFAVGLVAGKRITPRLDARLRYAFTRRYARDGHTVVAGAPDDVFDQQYHEVGLEGSFLVTDALLFGAGFTYRRGDFDSNAQDSRFDVLARKDVDAVARDDVFGGWVYRTEGNAYSPFVRLNYGLTDRWSLALGYRFQLAEGDGSGLRYRTQVVTGGVLFRY